MRMIRFNLAHLGLFAFVVIGSGSGCAFVDAATFGPNFSNIQVGTKRVAVENELGYPRTRILSKPGISIDVYEYRVNDNPSRLRALGNLIKSVFTIGIWEFWSTERTTPYRLRVIYDKDQRVSEIRQVDVYADQEYEGNWLLLLQEACSIIYMSAKPIYDTAKLN